MFMILDFKPLNDANQKIDATVFAFNRITLWFVSINIKQFIFDQLNDAKHHQY